MCGCAPRQLSRPVRVRVARQSATPTVPSLLGAPRSLACASRPTSARRCSSRRTACGMPSRTTR
eukprot:5273270-Prymnesium_polylepis.1